jgi:hypothetical protein
MENDFITKFRNQYSQKTKDAANKESKAWDNASLLGEYYDNYNKARKERGDKSMSYNDFTLKVSDMVGKMGVEDGKWSQEDYDNKSYRDSDNYEDYANNVLNKIMGGIAPWRGNLSQEIDDNAPEEVKEAYNRIRKYGDSQWSTEAVNERTNQRYSDDKNVFDIAGSTFGTIGDKLGSGFASIWNSPYNNSDQKKSDMKIVNDYRKQMGDTAIAMFDDFDTFFDEYKKNKSSDKKATDNNSGTNESGSSASATGGTSSSDDDVVTFQLDRANDPNYKGFGQKIVDLGLATDNGLWGSNGDVAFYTQQLYEQGAVDKNGNLKIGVPIKLRRRK